MALLPPFNALQNVRRQTRVFLESCEPEIRQIGAGTALGSIANLFDALKQLPLSVSSIAKEFESDLKEIQGKLKGAKPIFPGDGEQGKLLTRIEELARVLESPKKPAAPPPVARSASPQPPEEMIPIFTNSINLCMGGLRNDHFEVLKLIGLNPNSEQQKEWCTKVTAQLSADLKELSALQMRFEERLAQFSIEQLKVAMIASMKDGEKCRIFRKPFLDNLQKALGPGGDISSFIDTLSKLDKKGVTLSDDDIALIDILLSTLSLPPEDTSGKEADDKLVAAKRETKPIPPLPLLGTFKGACDHLFRANEVAIPNFETLHELIGRIKDPAEKLKRYAETFILIGKYMAEIKRLIDETKPRKKIEELNLAESEAFFREFQISAKLLEQQIVKRLKSASEADRKQIVGELVVCLEGAKELAGQNSVLSRVTKLKENHIRLSLQDFETEIEQIKGILNQWKSIKIGPGPVIEPRIVTSCIANLTKILDDAKGGAWDLQPYGAIDDSLRPIESRILRQLAAQKEGDSKQRAAKQAIDPQAGLPELKGEMNQLLLFFKLHMLGFTRICERVDVVSTPFDKSHIDKLKVAILEEIRVLEKAFTATLQAPALVPPRAPALVPPRAPPRPPQQIEPKVLTGLSEIEKWFQDLHANAIVPTLELFIAEVAKLTEGERKENFSALLKLFQKAGKGILRHFEARVDVLAHKQTPRERIASLKKVHAEMIAAKKSTRLQSRKIAILVDSLLVEKPGIPRSKLIEDYAKRLDEVRKKELQIVPLEKIEKEIYVLENQLQGQLSGQKRKEIREKRITLIKKFKEIVGKLGRRECETTNELVEIIQKERKDLKELDRDIAWFDNLPKTPHLFNLVGIKERASAAHIIDMSIYKPVDAFFEAEQKAIAGQEADRKREASEADAKNSADGVKVTVKQKGPPSGNSDLERARNALEQDIEMLDSVLGFWPESKEGLEKAQSILQKVYDLIASNVETLNGKLDELKPKEVDIPADEIMRRLAAAAQANAKMAEGLVARAKEWSDRAAKMNSPQKGSEAAKAKAAFAKLTAQLKGLKS